MTAPQVVIVIENAGKKNMERDSDGVETFSETEVTRHETSQDISDLVETRRD